MFEFGCSRVGRNKYILKECLNVSNRVVPSVKVTYHCCGVVCPQGTRFSSLHLGHWGQSSIESCVLSKSWWLSLVSAYPHHIRGTDNFLSAPHCGADKAFLIISTAGALRIGAPRDFRHSTINPLRPRVKTALRLLPWRKIRSPLYSGKMGGKLMPLVFHGKRAETIPYNPPSFFFDPPP